ncbi:hypothetical protein JCM10207_001061 [Rhodosporidiobolus poonsookiae]
MAAPPPPRRTVNPSPSPAPASGSAQTSQSGGGWKAKAKGWGMKALDKSIVVSDKIGAHANNLSRKAGGENFWPVSGDFPQECDKCIRILKAFTVDGVAQKVEEKDANGKAKKGKVFMKIPASILADPETRGVVIYASQRMGTPPFGGSGGSGLIMAKLPDGSWSAPSAIAPGNFSAGLLFGIDLFEAVLIIRSEAAMEAFYTHKVTLGAEIGVSAGPYGAGGIAEAGVKSRAPVLSYVRSRGFYAGVEAVAQVWFARFDENERVYGTMGATQKEILTGHFRPTYDALPLLQALREAETGVAQRSHGAEYEFTQPFQTEDAALPEGRTAAEEPPASGTAPEAQSAGAEPPTYDAAATQSAAPPSPADVKQENELDQAMQPDPAFFAGLGPPPSLPARPAAAPSTSA